MTSALLLRRLVNGQTTVMESGIRPDFFLAHQRWHRVSDVEPQRAV
jgi:hypothetical protein